jgi:hypothetical protein
VQKRRRSEEFSSDVVRRFSSDGPVAYLILA